MGQAAQDAGVGRFEHILLCTDSMAEATVQTLPVRNCVVCSLSVPPFFFPTIVAQKQRGNNLRTGWPRALSDGKHLDFWLAAVIWGFSTLEVGGGFPQYFLRRHLRQCRVGVTSYLGAG